MTSIDDDLTHGASMRAADRAAHRVGFQLTYARSPVPRVFSPGWLNGPDIDNAYGGGLQSGGWDSPDDWTLDLDEDGWVDRYATVAVREAVHEALEWFRADGKPWLDPHGPAEAEIHALCGEFAEKLVALRRERAS